MMYLLQVWNLTNCKLKTNHYGHTGYLNCVTVSPDGSLCASGGKVRQIDLTHVIGNKGNNKPNLTDKHVHWQAFFLLYLYNGDQCFKIGGIK